MVAFKSRSLLYFDARTWTLIIAWYQIITCTLDMSRTQRQLVKFNRNNSELPVIYHNFTTSRGRPNPNKNGGKTHSDWSSGSSGSSSSSSSSSSSNIPSSLDVYKISEGGGKDKSNQSITLIISLDGRHSNENQNQNANDNDHDNDQVTPSPSPLSLISNFTIPTTFPPKLKEQETKEKDRGRSLFSDRNQNQNPIIINPQTRTRISSNNITLSALNGNSSSNIPGNVPGNVFSLVLNSNSNSNNSPPMFNDTNLNNETLGTLNGNGNGNPTNGTSVENVTRSDLSDNETKSEFIFRFRYNIILLYAEIVAYAVTAVSAVVLIIGTNKGSAAMLMTWLTVNWLNFLLALFAMILVMLRGLPINSFLYYAIKTGVRMLFIRVVSIHRRELLIYNDICEHLASIRAAQEAVFTMSDGMAHVNYGNP